MLTLPLHVYYVREREAAKQRTSDRTDSTWSVYSSSRETHDYSTQVYQVKVAGDGLSNIHNNCFETIIIIVGTESDRIEWLQFTISGKSNGYYDHSHGWMMGWLVGLDWIGVIECSL